MIHKYKLFDNNIVIDVESGAIHLFDDISYDIIELLDTDEVNISENCPEQIFEVLNNKYDKESVESAYKEIYTLYQNQSLFTTGEYEQYSNKFGVSPVKAMCLHVAHDCNLRCKYCFASTGDFEGTRCLMNLETGKKAIDFLIKHSGNRRNLELDFFGGEPLMNFDLVKEVVKYARELEEKHNKNFRFTITTNGLWLNDDNIEFINKEMVNVVLSLDGRKEVNDNMRGTINGKGSYDVIVPKFKQLVDSRGDKQYYVRGTFTKHNLDFSEDVLHIAELGFDQVSVEPVVGEDGLDYTFDNADIEIINKEYEKLAGKLLDLERQGKGINFFHFVVDLKGGPCAIKRIRGCGCGNEYVAITPEGDIYPCHQFVGMDEWKMGSLYDQTFDIEKKKTFASTNIYTKEDCKDCWAKFYCSGGCTANSVQYCGDMNKPYKISCDLEKKRLECAIIMQVEKLKQNS